VTAALKKLFRTVGQEGGKPCKVEAKKEKDLGNWERKKPGKPVPHKTTQ